MSSSLQCVSGEPFIKSVRCGSCGPVRATLFHQVGDISCKARMSSLGSCVWWGKQFQPYQTAVYGERVTWCMAEAGGTFHHYIINPLTATICPNLCNLQNLLCQCRSIFTAFLIKAWLFMGLRWRDYLFPDHRVSQWWGSGQVRSYKQEK